MSEIQETDSRAQSPLVFIVKKRQKPLNKPSQFSKNRQVEQHSIELNNTQDQETKECRICLQSVQSKQVIKPCKCTGNISYVHQSCLKEWILRLIMKDVPVECQFCKEPYQYICTVNKIINCGQFSVNWSKKKREMCCSLALLIGLIIAFIAFIAILIVANISDNSLTRKLIANQTALLFLIVGLIIVATLLAIFIALFMNEYCTQKQKSIKLIRQPSPRIKILKKQSREQLSERISRKMKQNSKVIRI